METHGDSIEIVKLAGIIKTATIDRGSKSERLGYRIIGRDGGHTDLVRLGESSFSNPTLSQFEGQEVEVMGELDGDVFLVESIRSLR